MFDSPQNPYAPPTPNPVADRTRGPGDEALRLVIWAWLAQIAVTAAWRVVTPVALRVASSTTTNSGSFESLWKVISLLSYAANLGVFVFLLVALHRAWRRSAPSARSLVLFALVTIAVLAAMVLVSALLHHAFDARLQWMAWVWRGAYLAEAVAFAAVLVLVARGHAPLRGLVHLLWGSVAVGVILALVNSFVSESGAYRVLQYLRLGVELTQIVLLTLLVKRMKKRGSLAGTVSAPAPHDDGERFRAAPWPEVRAGLASYAAAVITRLVLVLAVVGLSALASQARSFETIKLVMVVGAGGAFLIGIWMLVALNKISAAPSETGARGALGAAIIVSVIALLLDGYALLLVIKIYGGRLSAIFDVMKQLPWVQAGGQILALVAMLALLGGLSRLARFAEAQAVVVRFRRTAMLIGVVAGGNLLLRLLVATRSLLPLVLFLAAGALLLAVWGLALFLGGLRELRLALSSGDEWA